MPETMEREGKQVLQRLADAGYEAYFVGGCVRDKLLGRPLKDIDIATSALPDDVIRLFPRTAPTGLQHGTVTVITESHTFEVTTFRKESAYEQFRRPKEVEFISDLNEDLRRRDFTINAMALDADGTVIDPFGGTSDLAERRIRCVGDPLERFHEDALRMLRGIRFACEYGFEPVPETWNALVLHAPLLKHVAMERVYAELDKMVEGRDPDRAVRLLAASGLPRHFKMSVDWPLSEWDEAPELFRRETLGTLQPAELRWTGLFLLMGMDADGARPAMKRLTFSGKKSDCVHKLLQTDSWWKSRVGESAGRSYDSASVSFEAVALCAVTFGKAAVREWLKLAEWQRRVLPGCLPEPLIERAGGWLDDVPVDRVPELAVGGGELSAELDRPTGPWLGELLRDLLTEVAARRLPNERTALLEAAKTLAKRDSGR